VRRTLYSQSYGYKKKRTVSRHQKDQERGLQRLDHQLRLSWNLGGCQPCLHDVVLSDIPICRAWYLQIRTSVRYYWPRRGEHVPARSRVARKHRLGGEDAREGARGREIVACLGSVVPLRDTPRPRFSPLPRRCVLLPRSGGSTGVFAFAGCRWWQWQPWRQSLVLSCAAAAAAAACLCVMGRPRRGKNAVPAKAVATAIHTVGRCSRQECCMIAGFGGTWAGRSADLAKALATAISSVGRSSHSDFCRVAGREESPRRREWGAPAGLGGSMATRAVERICVWRHRRRRRRQ